jgi:hypothetical protein
VGIGHQQRVIAQRRRAPAGGVDAIVGLGAGDDQPLDALLGQQIAQFGLIE